MGEAGRVKKWPAILAAIIVVLLAVGVYKAKSDAAKARADVRQLEESVADKQADIRALRAEIAERESPGEIEHLAREHLGVTPGQGPQAMPERDLERRLPAPQNMPQSAHP
jgi:cell division protein FtsL